MVGGSEFFKDTDKAFTQQNQKDGQKVGESVKLRIVSGRTAGNPAAGEQPTLIFKTKKTTAVISRVSAEEITNSGGIYQYGDLSVDLLEELNFADERTGTIGDRMIYQNTTYRIVGRSQNQNIEGRNMLFRYVMRKVGNE